MPRPHPHRRPHHGFTLLEVMVALVIFSLIGVGTFGVLASLRQAQVTIEARGGQLEKLQRLLLLAQRDISQIVARTPDSAIGTGYVHLSASGPLSFARLGWTNPLGDPRSELAYVRYSAAGGSLLREVWPLQQSANNEPALSWRLSSAADIAFSGTEAPDDSAAASAPAPGGMAQPAPPPALPGAIEMTATVPYFGSVSQLIPVVRTP